MDVCACLCVCRYYGMHVHVFIHGLPCVHVCTRVLICVRVSVYICMGYIYVCMCMGGEKYENLQTCMTLQTCTCMYECVCVWIAWKSVHKHVLLYIYMCAHGELLWWIWMFGYVLVRVYVQECKKKVLEEGGGASFVSNVSTSEGFQRSSSRGGFESPRIQGGTQTCHCALFSLLPGTLVRSLCSGSGTVSWVLDWCCSYYHVQNSLAPSLAGSSIFSNLFKSEFSVYCNFWF